MMEKWKGCIALVTGASIGIGASISKLLVKSGMVVYGCGRHFEKMSEMKASISGPGLFHPIKCDVSNEKEVCAMLEFIEKENDGVNVVINNAGLGYFSTILEGEMNNWIEMLNVNVLGLCMVTRESVKLMKRKNIENGQIINISSLSGHRVPPNAKSFYTGTKFAVTALTEGIRHELTAMNSNIRICQISPGLVKTDFQNRASGGTFSWDNAQYLESDDIASSVEFILSRPKHVQVHDILIRPTEQIS